MALVKEGDAVNRNSVDEWFPRSIVFAVERLGAEIIGVGVVKPEREYTKRVAERSGFELSPKMCELGYVAVKEEHRRRGIAGDIVRELLSSHGVPLFATTSNSAMERTLKRNGFVERGRKWTSDRDNTELSLWVIE